MKYTASVDEMVIPNICTLFSVLRSDLGKPIAVPYHRYSRASDKKEGFKPSL